MDLTSSNATPNKHIKPKALSLKTIAYCDGVLENHFEKGDTKSQSVGVGGNAKVAGFLFDPGGKCDVQSLHIVNMGLISSCLENGVCCALTNESEFMNGGTTLLNLDPGGIDSIDKRRHCGDFDYNNVEHDMEDYTTTYSPVKRVVRMLEILYYLLHTRRKSWYIWDLLDKKAFLHDTLSTLITADLKDGCFPASNFTSSCNLCPVHRGELLILQAGDKKLLTKESVGSMVTDVGLQIHALLEIHLACEVTLEELMLNNVKGTVVLGFQPSKEGGEGAEKIVDARALDHVSVIFRVHLNLMLRVSLVRMNVQFLPGEVKQAYIIIMVVFLFDLGGSTSLSNTWGFKNCIFPCSNMIEGSIEGSSNLTVKATLTTYGDDIDSLAVALNVSHVVQLNLDIFVDICKSIAFILQKQKSGNIFELLSATYSLSISKELKSSVRSPTFECTEVFIIILSLTNVGIETTLDILYEDEVENELTLLNIARLESESEVPISVIGKEFSDALSESKGLEAIGIGRVIMRVNGDLKLVVVKILTELIVFEILPDPQRIFDRNRHLMMKVEVDEGNILGCCLRLGSTHDSMLHVMRVNDRCCVPILIRMKIDVYAYILVLRKDSRVDRSTNDILESPFMQILEFLNSICVLSELSIWRVIRMEAFQWSCLTEISLELNTWRLVFHLIWHLQFQDKFLDELFNSIFVPLLGVDTGPDLTHDTNTEGGFIMVKLIVGALISCLGILCHNRHFKKALRWFFKLVNGLDPPPIVYCVELPGSWQTRGRVYLFRGEIELMQCDPRLFM